MLSGKFEGRVASAVRLSVFVWPLTSSATSATPLPAACATAGRRLVIGAASCPPQLMIDSVLSTSQTSRSVLLTDAGRDGVAEEANREMVARRGTRWSPPCTTASSPYPSRSGTAVLNGVADRPGAPGAVPDERQGAHETPSPTIGSATAASATSQFDDTEVLRARASDSYRDAWRLIAVDESLVVVGELD